MDKEREVVVVNNAVNEVAGICSRAAGVALLKLDNSAVHNFLASLLSKRLVVITGLSGSGKTKMTQFVGRWLTSNSVYRDPFQVGGRLEAARKVYQITDVDRLGVEFANDDGTKVLLPRAIIEQWAEYISQHAIDEQIGAQELRDKIKAEKGEYSPYLQNFETHYKPAAFALLKAQRTRVQEPAERCVLIAVGADWTSNENLLGYPDVLNPGHYHKPDNGVLDLVLRAKNDPDQPYFLILDEMNLSHVERYFADFLSAMESGEAINLHDDTGSDWDGVPATLKIPENLFVIGTVNVDETTYMFSPKVLDRANVIEFRVSKDEMQAFLTNPVKPNLDAIAGQGAQYAKAFVAEARQKNIQLDEETRDKVSGVLMEFFPQLQEAGAEFGYRTAHEICRFVYFHRKLTGEGWEFNAAMDAAIMQKLLPKLHGSKKKLGPVLEKLNGRCAGKFPVSIEKIVRMQKRLAEHGFTSFAEA
jgi:hypothetical protein